jgi:hypothetical protein
MTEKFWVKELAVIEPLDEATPLAGTLRPHTSNPKATQTSLLWFFRNTFPPLVSFWITALTGAGPRRLRDLTEATYDARRERCVNIRMAL